MENERPEATGPNDTAQDETAQDDAGSPPAPAATVDVGRPQGVDLTPDGTYVGRPAKVMRIGTMVKQLLEEVRSAPLDEAALGRLAEVHDRALRELEDGLSPDLVAELRRITLPFPDDANPSEAELRIAQAQLVGWLEGLFHGLQTALVAQQMSTQGHPAQGRRALPSGATPAAAGTEGPAGRRAAPGVADDDRRAPGQYL